MQHRIGARASRRALAAVGVLVICGCGSTATLSGASQPGGQAGLGPADGGALSSGASAETSSGGQGTAAGVSGAGDSNGTRGSAGDATGVAGGQSSEHGGASATGVTKTTISVGILYVTNGDAADAAIGAANITSGDERADAQAVIDDINTHGGVAGRKLVPVWTPLNAESTEPASTQEQQWCANFTQDHHVFAAVAFGDATLLTCVTRSAIMIGNDEDIGPNVGFDDQDFAHFPFFVDPGTLSLDNVAKGEVSLWLRDGYFSPWNASTGGPGGTAAKVAVLSVDAPAFNRTVDQVLLPQLAQHGIHIKSSDVYRIAGASEAAVVSSIQNATLRMRANGIDHVIDLDSNASLTLLFANDAYSQHYYPRLGINTADGLQALQGDIQPQSENGAEGLGWYPILDLPSSVGSGGAYSSAGQRRCVAVMHDAGLSFSSTSAEAVALTFCDDLYLLQRAAGSVPVISRANFMAAVDRIGTTFAAASLTEMYFAADHHDGVTQGWDMRYVSSCQCLQYVGSPFTIP